MRVAFSLLVVASATLAAPVPKAAKKKGDYFPTAVGSKWEYVQEGTDTLDHTREVTESDEKDGVRTATFRWTSHANAYTKGSRYRIDAGGVWRLGWDDHNFDEPNLMLKAGAKAGESWDAGITKKKPAEFVNELGAEEEVVTPAGKFQAVSVKVTQAKGGLDTYWYAPDVGMVRWKFSNGKAIVLSTFTPGK
ncbi:MAG: hypothetical protein ABGY75_09230 [Gemmataceae bacterium]